MGAIFKTVLLDGSLSHDALERRFVELQENAAHEHGHSFSADWNMARGLLIQETPIHPPPKPASVT